MAVRPSLVTRQSVSQSVAALDWFGLPLVSVLFACGPPELTRPQQKNTKLPLSRLAGFAVTDSTQNCAEASIPYVERAFTKAYPVYIPFSLPIKHFSPLSLPASHQQKGSFIYCLECDPETSVLALFNHRTQSQSA